MFISCSYEHHVIEWWFIGCVIICCGIFHIGYHVEYKFAVKYGRDKTFSLSLSFYPPILPTELIVSFFFSFKVVCSRHWSCLQPRDGAPGFGQLGVDGLWKKIPENKNVSAEVQHRCEKLEKFLCQPSFREKWGCDFLLFLPRWIEQWGNVLATCREWSLCDLRSLSKPRCKMMQ